MNTSKDEMADQSILLVDDAPGILKAVSSVLADEGCQVASTSDSHCTLETLGRYGFKLVITDLAMPFIDRITLLRKAKDVNPRTKVVVTTAYQEPKCQAEAFALRVDG
jgi:CheY-like chemotaxis protein